MYKSMKFCPECGSKLGKSSKFCGYCGFKIQHLTKTKIEPTEKHEEYIKHYSKRGGSSGKKIAAIIIIFAIVGVGFFLIPRLWIVGAVGGLPLMQPPTIDVYDAKLSGIGLSGIGLDLTLDVYNPNDLPITFDRADFDVYINDVNVGSGSLPNLVSVSGKTHSYPSTSMSISYGGGLAGGWEYLKGAIGGGGSTMKISGTAYVQVPVLGDVPVSFTYSKRV